MIKNLFIFPAFLFCNKSAPVDSETCLITPNARCVTWHHGTLTVARFAAKLRVRACLSLFMCPPLTIPYPSPSAEVKTRVFAYSEKTG